MQASDSAAEASVQRATDGVQLSEADARFQRTMKIVVGALGFLVVAALVAVVVRVIYLASRPATQPAAQTQDVATPTQAAAPTPAVRRSQSLTLPPGAVVRSMALSGDRLAVHYDAPGRSGIAVLDLKTGRTLTNVRIESQAADE